MAAGANATFLAGAKNVGGVEGLAFSEDTEKILVGALQHGHTGLLLVVPGAAFTGSSHSAAAATALLLAVMTSAADWRAGRATNA